MNIPQKIGLILLLVLMCTPAHAEITEDYLFIADPNYELDIRPGDASIEPDPNDGAIIVKVEGWLYIVYWKEVLASYLGRWLSGLGSSPVEEFLKENLIRIIYTLAGFCFFIFFSRRMFPEENPNSTPAKILAYVREHPGVSQKQIIDAVGKSRGSVAYQLVRLKREKKIRISTQNGRAYYYPSAALSPFAEEIQKLLADEETKEIFVYLYRFPSQSCESLGEALSKKPYSIRHHLKKFSGSVLETEKKRRTVYYSLSKNAREEYVRLLTSPALPPSSKKF